MKNLTGNEIRKMWIEFFRDKGHKVIDSASLIPKNDKTLLWIGAGVAPLKKYFDGSVIPDNPRMVNVQKSLRTTDIKNVGMTARHHTFFEMLGNFSIGDYFREDAIRWGFELLTSEKYFNFDLDKLYFTVYPTDEESYKLWKELGVSEAHIIKTNYNFWEIGEGPCGPCTEIFFDRGEKYGNITPDVIRDDIENDRYIEIWNIVFSQFNSKADLDRSEYQELPSKNIDTGMGLERMACVLQEVETNYETDLFMPIMKKVEEITGVPYEGQMSFKVIADHLRTVTFALADGAMLGNEGRGYVLRRILRRAVRHGKILGKNEPFLFTLVDSVISVMGDFYPYLNDKKELICKVIEKEEIRFHQTLEDGEKRLRQMIENSDNKTISGKDAFTLYDTFGFPFELTLEYALEEGYEVDREGFEKEMEEQKRRARASRANVSSMSSQNEEMLNYKDESLFIGYESLESNSNVQTIFKDGKIVESALNKLDIVFNETPFYAESGGQLNDLGVMIFKDSEYKVIDVQKMPNGQHLHTFDLGDEVLNVGDNVKLVVSDEMRDSTACNHSATHLLHKALKDVLGSHVSQQGSQVSNESLRFDFNHIDTISDEEILKIEKIVNNQIEAAIDVDVIETSITKAKEMGAEALFGEKYGDVVRVVNMDYSIELCGGTHVKNTSDIKRFAIKSIESKGSGIYRIEALTNNQITKGLNDATSNYKSEIESILTKGNKIVQEANKQGFDLKLNYLSNDEFIPSYMEIINSRSNLSNCKEAVKNLQKEFEKLSQQSLMNDLSIFEDNIEKINDKYVLIVEVDSFDMKALKEIADNINQKYDPSIIFVANKFASKVTFIAKISKELITSELTASNLVKQAAIICSGNGGGRPDFAQAGAKDVTKVKEALTEIEKLTKK